MFAWIGVILVLVDDADVWATRPDLNIYISLFLRFTRIQLVSYVSYYSHSEAEPVLELPIHKVVNTFWPGEVFDGNVMLSNIDMLMAASVIHIVLCTLCF